MVTLEQKLSLFSKLLQQDVNNEIGEKIQKMEKEYEGIVADHKRKVDRDARHIVERAEKKGEEKRLELMSKAKMYTKKQGMFIKERYIDIFIERLVERFQEFSRTPEYKNYIEKLLKELDGIEADNTFIIYMTQQDKVQYGELVKNYLVALGLDPNRLSVEERNTHILGGIILENPEKNLRIDLSAYTHIQDHKDFIIESVFSAIGEVGEGDE